MLPEGSGASQSQRATLKTNIDCWLDTLGATVETRPGNEVHDSFASLRKALVATAARESRPKGGFEYKIEYHLDAVILADRIKVLEDMPTVIKESLSMVVHPDLLSHLSPAVCAPSKATLYEYRVKLDMASMLFCRDQYLTREKGWHCHIRLDSSPQYGKDFLLAEMDIVKDSLQWSDVGPNITTRILVGQSLGSRATSFAVKARKTLHMLSLESASLSVTLTRVRSILFDWGVESHLWKTPTDFFQGLEESTQMEQAFGLALPIPDADHSLHHIMQVLENNFHWEDFFQPRLHAVSLFFSREARCLRFSKVCIVNNNAIGDWRLKKSFLAMFKTTCPLLCSRRWHYVHLC